MAEQKIKLTFSFFQQKNQNFAFVVVIPEMNFPGAGRNQNNVKFL